MSIPDTTTKEIDMKALWIATVTATRVNAIGKHFSTTAANVFANEIDASNYRADQRKAWYKDASNDLLENVVHVTSTLERLPIDADKLAEFERKFKVTIERQVTFEKVYNITASTQDEATDEAESQAEYDDWYDEGYEVSVSCEDTDVQDCDEVDDFD